MTTWEKTNKGKKSLIRQAQKGDTYYGTAEVSRRVAPYEDPELAKRFTVTHMHPILGGPMCGPSSLESILWEFGPLHDSKPAGIRGEWEPTPQYPGVLAKYIEKAKKEVLGEDDYWDLNRRELRELEEAVTQALANRDGKATAKRKIAKASGDPTRLLKLVA